MARSLKNTGVAANVIWLAAVDDDNSTIKIWNTPGASTGWTHGSGLTNSGISVDTGKTWKSVSVPMLVLGSSNYLEITTSPAMSTPCCFFMVVKDWGAENTLAFVSGAATAGGAVDITKAPWVYTNSAGAPWLRDQFGGIGLSAPLTANDTVATFSSGDDFSAFLNELNGANNTQFWELEANTLTSNSFTRTDQGVNFSTVYAKRIGYTGSTGSVGTRVVMCGFLNAAISSSDAASIHADPFGTMFDTTGGVTVTDASDENFYEGETAIPVIGTGFGASQGTGTVKISPTNNVADGAAVTQTVTAWTDTQVTITANQSPLASNTGLYLFVTNNAGQSNATGYTVQFGSVSTQTRFFGVQGSQRTLITM